MITIRNALIIDEPSLLVGSQERVDVCLEGNTICGVYPARQGPQGDLELDASDCVISPSLVDLHVHLREPGREESETIESGSRAAALGGFGAVVAMPNTEPAQDSAAVIAFVREQGRRAGWCEVVPAGCITVGRCGETLVPFADLSAAGVTLFTDDGNGVQDPMLMRRALEYASDLGITLAQHCEVNTLTAGAIMHEGSCCSRLGLPGWPALAEELMVHRDIELARLTGGRVHLLHLSTAGSVALVRAAKADGLAVTAEAAPHHFTLTDELLASFDPVYKVNPPLRTMSDIAALKAGLRDGTIDAIATDHAPHADHLKEQPLDQAPPGMLGLQTALALSITELTGPGDGESDFMTLGEVVAALSWKPARIAGIADRFGRPIAVGEPANVVIFNPGETWTVSRLGLASRSRNTPYDGRELRGTVRHTIFGGRPVVIDGRSVEREAFPEMQN